MGKKLKICFMGGKEAGINAVLTVLSEGHDIICAASYSDDLTDMLGRHKVPVSDSINDAAFILALHKADLLLSVHGREVVPSELLAKPSRGSVNVHPFLYAYKGKDPVGRALNEGNFKASVGAHIMTDELDGGKLLVEEFLDISGTKTREEAYEKLYPVYQRVVKQVLDVISND